MKLVKPTSIRHRVPSLQTPKRDHAAESMQSVVDTMEGRNNPVPRELPRLDLKQALQTMIVVTSKEPCYICQQTPHCVETYRVPGGLDTLGQQLIFYTLCFACKADVATKGKVEYRLVQHLKAENAVCS